MLDTLAVPTGAGRPRGLAYDGAQFLYAVMDEPGGFDDVIYKIDLSTEGTPVYVGAAAEVDFGVVGTGETNGFSVQNTGDAPLVIGDVNGDGAADLAVGSTLNDVFVLDGATGSVLWSAPLGGQVFGVDAVADVDGDGIAEVAATGSAGTAVLLSGADGEPLWSYGIGNGSIDQSGEVIVAVPDLDGNGFPEVAVGARHGRVALLTAGGDPTTDAADDATTPTAFALEQSYPNPFRSATTIRYTLAERADVRLTVYNLLGQRVSSLVAQEHAAGAYAVTWNGTAAGDPLAAGVYLVRLEAGPLAQTRRLVLVR